MRELGGYSDAFNRYRGVQSKPGFVAFSSISASSVYSGEIFKVFGFPERPDPDATNNILYLSELAEHILIPRTVLNLVLYDALNTSNNNEILATLQTDNFGNGVYTKDVVEF